MLRLRATLAIALLVTAIGHASAQSFVGKYAVARSPALQELQAELKRAHFTEQLADALTRDIDLPKALVVATAECGTANAYYSPQNSAVIICLELLNHLSTGIRRDLGHALAPEELPKVVAGAVGFIVAHEVGHALIDQLELPVLGREEDAADQIGTFFVLGSANAPTALAGALWFFRGKTVIYTRKHFSDEHSMGPQRQSNLACWAYGKDQQKFGYLLNGGYLPQARASRCAAEFAKLDRSVRQLIGSRLRVVSGPGR